MKLLNTLLVLIAMIFMSLNVKAVEPDWSNYEKLLNQNVHPGFQDGIKLMEVDYVGIKSSPLYSKAVFQIETFNTRQLQSKTEKLAFYINAYNLYAIKMVIDHWPVKGIKDIGNFFSPVWDKDVGFIDKKPVTLNEIEHEILRKMDEPRIHMAIVCASISCPDLRNEAYTSEKLDAQLNDQTILFLNNNGKGLKVYRQTAVVSKIYYWFEEDFDAQGGVTAFIKQYRKDLAKEITIDADLPYNWKLNKISQ